MGTPDTELVLPALLPTGLLLAVWQRHLGIWEQGWRANIGPKVHWKEEVVIYTDKISCPRNWKTNAT